MVAFNGIQLTNRLTLFFSPPIEVKVERKMDEVDSEEQARGADAAATFASQPQRIALFPGVDSQALKVNI